MNHSIDLNQFNALKSNLENTDVIVTGANGFIGSVIVWQLNQIGITNIIAVDSVLQNERNLLTHLKIKKFMSKNDLIAYLDHPVSTSEVSNHIQSEADSKNISWIIHMGACSSTTETNKDFLLENNTEYSQKLFNWCTKNNVGYIYASSAATYGAGENGFDDKTDSEILKPLNLYGDSKVLMDRWAAKQQNKPLHWYALKFFNVYGPMEYHKESMSSVIFKSFHLIKKTGKVQLFKSHKVEYKDGEQLRDFVYVKDVSYWILELMLKKPVSGIYNMGFGKARTWKDLVTNVFHSMNKTVQIEWIEIPENIRNQYQYFTLAKMDKWNSQNLSEPKWSLEDGIKDYVSHYLLNENAFLKSKN